MPFLFSVYLNGCVLLTYLLISTASFGNDRLEKIVQFGENPGNLNMYVRTPKAADNNSKLPLVVVLHGCTQSAEEALELAGWNDLADRFQFVVLLPEQKRANNVSKCFNWFLNEDVDPVNGEAASIQQMIAYTLENYQVDSTSVFITGVSAGAVMATALMVNNSCLFRAGAILSGGPIGYAKNALTGYQLMKNPPNYSPEEWAKFLPENNSKCVPRMVVMHGTEDELVNFKNAEELVDQWRGFTQFQYLKPIDIYRFDGNELVDKRIYENDQGDAVICFYTIKKLGHALAVDPGNKPHQGGRVAKYAADIDFFSTYYILRDFGLIDMN